MIDKNMQAYYGEGGDSGKKSINQTAKKTFKMNSDKTLSIDFTKSSLGDDYFWFYVAHDDYQWRINIYGWYKKHPTVNRKERTKDTASWPRPHSTPYVPAVACTYQLFIPKDGNYNLNFKFSIGINYNAYEDYRKCSAYRMRLDIDGTEIKDFGWATSDEHPWAQCNFGASLSKAAIENHTKAHGMFDFGTYKVNNLTKGIHNIDIRVGGCHTANKHACMMILDYEITATKV